MKFKNGKQDFIHNYGGSNPPNTKFIYLFIFSVEIEIDIETEIEF